MVSSSLSLAETMLMTWEPSENAEGYIVRKGGCQGEIVQQSPALSFADTIETTTVYCLSAYNNYGESERVQRTAHLETPAVPVKITITIEVQ